ncbi:ABC transporter permease [Xylophilus sp. ASV27]|uniref:ABC transporter permease n=1 Tax=Xylophilus sp. ASV27 TaxID=2795129 RepID=UPI0018EA7017|nr:SMP-30/gluconolactonase/LRE family protein [Xylophilus sp. ASV27]
MDALIRLRYRYLPDHLVGELLSKRWADNAVPFVALMVVVALFGVLTPGMLTATGLRDLSSQVAEFGLVAIAMSVVMIAGGIDLALGATFALCVLAALTGMNVYHLQVWQSALLCLGTGALCGAVNGVLIGYLRLRAFLTTLVTMVLLRSLYDMVLPIFATRIVVSTPESALWEQLGSGGLLGIAWAVWLAALVALAWHIALSRSRPGWRIAAVGGARRAAYNAGIPVRSVVAMSYVHAGMLCGAAAFLYGARMGSVSSDTGVGMEIAVLTAVVLGGTTLGGGRGSVAKALLGSVVVLVLTNGLLQLGVVGTTASMILGLILLAGVFLDVRWVKNRQRLINSTYVSPAYFDIAPCPDTEEGAAGAYAPNSRLCQTRLIGEGRIEAPEDVALDREDHLYCGTRQGDIVRFLAPDYTRHEVFAHIGGTPLGMNFDRGGNLVVCVGGMGLYMVTPQREVVKLTDETPRSRFSIIDDSRLRLADDLDIAPDGRIFFSEATVRYNAHNWSTDMLESRGNGRLLCYDPRSKTTETVLRHLVFPNGVCCLPDGESLLFAETWACRVRRFWFDGPRKGLVRTVIANLPGYPDNINRASDGHYWLCLVGMRSPALDLAQVMPGFRRRMTRRVAPAHWLSPNLNAGCLIKITAEGEVLESAWDNQAVNHPSLTSCKEHKGYLYLGSLFNNRIGQWKIEGADPGWTGPGSYWGARA